ncbi:hypothetical protein SDC9_150822 [bioreactor metagenome]|uniref:Uncharacterized protein n=1 Tax=bioreactor metagenome TaxID=1076179 RepID=A0A645ENK8_9ZZZZ
MDRRRDTGDIADADSRGERGGQSLVVRDIARLTVGIMTPQQCKLQRRDELGELHPTQADRQPDARAEQ